MEFSHIHDAYKKCSKGKNKSLDTLRFESGLGFELVKLHQEINNRTYQPQSSRCFVVTHPRPREIWAASFRDRVVHHLIVDHLESLWGKSFASCSFACRKGKGVYAAIASLKHKSRAVSRGGRRDVWTLQLDIASFFVTIDREILRNLFLERVVDPEMIWLINTQFNTDPRSHFKKCGWLDNFQLISAEKSWLAKPPGQGIPIGNLTSQFGANLYLNELDQYILRKIKPQAYQRYMDDLLFLSDNPDQMRNYEKLVQTWLLEHRKQSLNFDKTVLARLGDGITHLGFNLKQVPDTKEVVLSLPQAKMKWNLVRTIRKIEARNWEKLFRPHELAFYDKSPHRGALQEANSRLGLISQAKSYRLRSETLGRLACRWAEDELLNVTPEWSAIRYNG